MTGTIVGVIVDSSIASIMIRSEEGGMRYVPCEPRYLSDMIKSEGSLVGREVEVHGDFCHETIEFLD